MNFKTLNYIHQLLVEQEARCRKAYEIARDARNEAEDNDAENVEALRAVCEKVRGSWDEAMDALRSFEDKEWT